MDPILGPEMKSTGEVMGIGDSFDEAFAKAALASGERLPAKGTAFMSVRDVDKPGAAKVAQDLIDAGFKVIATTGTAKALKQAGLTVDRVNKVRRQLRGTDTDVVTIASLRGACITFAEGIGGVRYGTRPVALADEKHPVVLERATEWFQAVTEAIGPAMEDRENKLASAPSVLTAIGAVGHELLHADDPHVRAKMRAELIDRLREVDWRRAKHWEGIAGKFTPKGSFSIGGSKETAYAIYGALTDDTSSAYQQVRPSTTAAA